MKGWCPLRQQPPSHTSAWHGPWTGRAIQRGKRDAAACVPHPIAVPGRLGTPRLPPSPMPRDPISSPGPASPRLASSHCACSKADLIMVTNEADGNAGHRRSSKSCWATAWLVMTAMLGRFALSHAGVCQVQQRRRSPRARRSPSRRRPPRSPPRAARLPRPRSHAPPTQDPHAPEPLPPYPVPHLQMRLIPK